MIVEPRDLSDDEQIKIMMQILGVDEVTARFIMAIERGEISGDIIELKKGEKPPSDE